MTRGEELPTAAVDAWLRLRMELVGQPEVTQYVGGASNWTYRLRYQNADLVLRRPPAGTKARSSHDMGREHRVQAALRPVFPLVPEMIASCGDESVIGAPFYVMRRIPGIIPRAKMPVPISRDQARQLCLNAVDTLVALHKVDAAKIGLADLGKGPGYPRRQIEGWAERYQKARTWNVPTFKGTIQWLRANAPDDSLDAPGARPGTDVAAATSSAGTCIIHNDFRLDNLVLDEADPTRIRGVLDWEMCTLGDPLMDLGNSLAYWIQADDDRVARATRRQPTYLPGMLTRKALVAAYFERAKMPPRDMTFYEVYGLFRLAGIIQQIYYRYHHKQTRNPAFRRFWILPHYLEWKCRRLVRRRSA